jgi:hypothetical protein
VKRIYLAFVCSLALSVGMATVQVSGVGDSEINLTCDDGSNLNVIVDLSTVIGLTQVVQAMLEYPAGLTCSLTQTAVTHAPLSASIAAAADKKDFAVGAVGVGTNLCFTGNISFQAHSDAANTTASTQGMIHEMVQPVLPLCPVNGTFKAEVHCLVVTGPPTSGSDSGRIARMSAKIVHTTGDFFPNFTRAILVVQDNGSPGTLDIFDINVDTNDPDLDTPGNLCNNPLTPFRFPTHGNTVVHDEV